MAEAVKLESACSLKSSDTKTHQGGSCAPTLMDLHVTFMVHPIAMAEGASSYKVKKG